VPIPSGAQAVHQIRPLPRDLTGPLAQQRDPGGFDEPGIKPRGYGGPAGQRGHQFGLSFGQ
jgi:hypothetical protein